MTVGGFALQTGDLLFSTAGNETLGGVAYEGGDIVLFRPTTPGNYSAGTFSLFFDRTDTGLTVTAFTLVEQTVTVGNATLNAGDLLLASGASTDIQRFVATQYGNTTAGSASVFIDGAGVGFGKNISALAVVDRTTVIGNTTLAAGTLIVSLDGEDASVGSGTPISITRFDLFTLTVATTGSGTTSATASLLLQGADVALDNNNEALVAATLLPNQGPTLGNQTFGLPENSANGTVVGTATGSDPEASTLRYAITAGNLNGAFAINATTGQITVANSAVLDFEGTPAFTLSVVAIDTDGAYGTATVIVNLSNVNEAPVIASLAGDALAYAEGAGAVVIEQGDNTLITDVDSADFNGGSLSVSFGAGSDNAEDVLGVRNEGSGAGQIGVSGANVTYGGVTIGTFSGGSGGTPLAIVFNASATPTAVTALTRNVTYLNTDTNAPTTGARTVRFVLTDGDGGTSANYDTTVTVSGVNDAPTATNLSAAESYAEDTPRNLTDIVISDVDNANVTATLTLSSVSAGSLNTGTSGAVTSTYNSGTGVWTASGAVADVNALLAALTFTPNANYNSAFTIATSVSDGVAAPVTGTKAMTGTPVNDAPSLASAYSLSGISEDQFNSAGTLVWDIVSSGVSDPDSGALQGIAVTAVDNSNGTWQYTLDGTNWFAIGNVSLNAARLLPADATTAVRFVPNANYNGVVFPFSYKAWDQTSGTAGGTGDASIAGGSTAFSTGTSGTSISVSPVNDAPTLANGTLAAVAEDTANPAGQTVSTIFAAQFADVDAGASLGGIAVVGNAANIATQGSWQYSSNGGGNWFAIGSVADGATALALSSTTLVRFVPVADYSGAPTPLVVRGLDNTYAGGFSSTAGSESRITVNTTSNGGTTAIAAATASLSTSITPVNDAPVITSNGAAASATVAVAENGTAVTTVTSTDLDGGAPFYSILAGGDAARFTIDSGTGALSFITAPDYENPTDAGGNNVYDLTVQVSDGNGGTDTQSIAVTVTNVADGIRVTPISVVPIGTETRVNTATADIQTINPNATQSIAADANGNFVVVWVSNLQDGSAYGIYAQRYGADGTAQGAEFLVNATTTDNQINPAVAMDGAGNFVVTWSSNLQDGSGYGVYAQRYNAVGAAQGPEFLVSTTTVGSQSGPAIAMAPGGAFVISWTSGGQDPDASSGIYAQRFDAGGVALGGEFRVNTYTTNTQQLAAVSMDATGNFVITWASNLQDDGASYGVYGQRFDAGGAARGTEFRVNTTIANSQLYHDVAMLPDGRFVVVYQSRNADNSFEVYLQRYAVDGSTIGGETRVNTATVSSAQQPVPSVGVDADGNITVTWNSAADGAGVGVVARRFDWSGTPLSGEFQVNTTTAGDQLYLTGRQIGGRRRERRGRVRAGP